MQSTWTWSQVITNLKGITAKTSGNTSVTTDGKWGVDTTNGMWTYIPSNAYYSTGHWLNVPWATCSSKINELGANPNISTITKNVQSYQFFYNGDPWASFKGLDGPTGSIVIPSGCVTCLLFVHFLSHSDIETRWTCSISGGTLTREFYNDVKTTLNQTDTSRTYIQQRSGPAGTTITVKMWYTHVNGGRGQIRTCALFF